MTGTSDGVGQDEALEGFYEALLDDDAEALYERAPCGYLSTTPDGTIVKVNQTFLAWTGFRREELVGRRSFAELLTGGGRIYHETHYAPLLRMQGKVREIALDIVAADGRRLPALVNSVLERDEAGRPTVVRAAVFDATERREYERELLRAKDRAEASEARAEVLARTLQRSLIPPATPHIQDLEVAAAYRPAGDGDEIGGDFYDVFRIGPRDWTIVVGDVRGKGVEAAVVTGLARYTIRAAAVDHPRPSRVLHTLNEVLLRDETDRFCTMAVVRLRRAGERWSATVACGGHQPPLLRRPGGGTVEVGRPGVLLGVFPHATFSDTHVALHPGDALVLFTDGVTEARREDEWYGEERTIATVAGAGPSAQAVTDELLADVLAFQSGRPRDDVVIVSIRVPDGR